MAIARSKEIVQLYDGVGFEGSFRWRQPLPRYPKFISPDYL